jgi:hypothetical protein
MSSERGTLSFFMACSEEERDLGVQQIPSPTASRPSIETDDGKAGFKDLISLDGMTLDGTAPTAPSTTHTIDTAQDRCKDEQDNYLHSCSQEERSLGAHAIRDSKPEGIPRKTYVSVFHDRLSQVSESLGTSARPAQEATHLLGSYLSSFGSAASQHAQSSVNAIASTTKSALGLGDRWTKIEESNPGLRHYRMVGPLWYDKDFYDTVTGWRVEVHLVGFAFTGRGPRYRLLDRLFLETQNAQTYHIWRRSGKKG